MAPFQACVCAGNPGIGHDEFTVPDATDMDRQFKGAKATLLVAPAQMHFLAQGITTGSLHGVDITLHGDEVGGLVLMPLDLVDMAGLDPAADTDGS